MNYYLLMSTQNSLMPNQKAKDILFFTPAIVWGISILFFSLMPGKELPNFLLSAEDALLHFGIYLGQSVLLLFAFNHYTLQSIKNGKVFFILAITFLLGAFIEFVQENFVAGRHFEWSDIFFNTLGAAVIILINYFLKKK